MRAHLKSEVAQYLVEHGPSTASAIAAGLRVRRKDVEDVLAKEPFVSAHTPEGGSPSAHYFTVLVNASSRVPRPHTLRQLLQQFMAESEKALRRYGLTGQWYLLLLLVQAGETSVTGLAREMYLAQSTTTELVQRVESAGLLTRTKSTDDRRVVVLEVTLEGRRRLKKAIQKLGDERGRLEELLELVTVKEAA